MECLEFQSYLHQLIPRNRTHFSCRHKPPPIRWLDARIKNGIGVMLDDLVAAFFTLLVIALWLRLTS